MLETIRRYTRWLHTRWPGGTVEKLPLVQEDGSTNVPGLFVAGDLTGVPLLKFAADSGARIVQRLAADAAFQRARERRADGVHDVVIIGGGVSGYAAALECRRLGLRFQLLEASEPFSTIVNFPRQKPIYTYPTGMDPAGELKVTAAVKEDLLTELRDQARQAGVEPKLLRAESVQREGDLLRVVIPKGVDLVALRVIVAIGRSGNFRQLGVAGEELDKVSNRLHDPKDFGGRNVLVVGGGDSALEAAIAIAQCGGVVTLSYRGREFSRPKPENLDKLAALQADPMADVSIDAPTHERQTTSSGPFLEGARKPGRITLLLGTQVRRIGQQSVVLAGDDGEQELPNDAVFAMIGREPPLDFFRKSGVKIRGETRGAEWIPIVLFFVAILLLYDWKNHGLIIGRLPALAAADAFPNNAPSLWSSLGAWWATQVADPATLLGTLAISMQGRSFYYTLLYSLAIVWFGVLRIRRRRTPYVRLQTLTLMAVQVLPLFLLPELILPWLGHNGVFDAGLGRTVADWFFPLTEGGHGREYWRAYGFVLAFPLMIWNVLTAQPLWGWLIVSALQVGVLLPWMVWRWGKGSFCGWICSCGGLAETMGDTLRYKMPHGRKWNALNMVGQALLLVAAVMLLLRVVGWLLPAGPIDKVLGAMTGGWSFGVDMVLGGILGVGLYVKYSGRVWCRFACPLAALMHIYARFSRFRILSEKQKCISCNVCTSVCHMGIDVMNFANKGLPMQDPECVRCSACVQACPTGVLAFGEVDRQSGDVIRIDRLGASPVRMREGDPEVAELGMAQLRGGSR